MVSNFLLLITRFLVDSANFLQQHLSTEGLFRKSGSVQRQKVLKVTETIGYNKIHESYFLSSAKGLLDCK